MKHLLSSILLLFSLALSAQRDTFDYSILIDLETDEAVHDFSGDTLLSYQYSNGGHEFEENYIFIAGVDTMQYFLDSLVLNLGNEIIEEQQRIEYIYNLFKASNSTLHNKISRYAAIRTKYADTYGYYPSESPYEEP